MLKVMPDASQADVPEEVVALSGDPARAAEDLRELGSRLRG